MAITATTAALIGTGAAVGIAAYSGQRQKKEASKARGQAEKMQAAELQAREFQAGEYYDLSEKQMELQSQAANIKTLADLIERTSEPAGTQVFTLPPAKTYSPVMRINMAIHEVFTR